MPDRRAATPGPDDIQKQSLEHRAVVLGSVRIGGLVFREFVELTPVGTEGGIYPAFTK